jgi:hypothetical protein
MPARSRRLSQTLLHSSQIASSGVMFRACVEPTRRRWSSPSSEIYRDPTFDTEAAPCPLRDHVLAGQLATGRLAEDARCHSGAEVTAGRDMAGAYGRPDRLDGPGVVIVAGIGG